MLNTVHGIVLRTVKYRDNKQVVDIYTETHGCLSFVAPVSRVRRSSGPSAALWRPLTFLECTVDIRPTNRMVKLKDARPYILYTDIPFSPLKSTIVLFLSEFLSHILHLEQSDSLLFRYLETALQWLDVSSKGIANFHLAFLLHLTTFVGIRPDLSNSFSMPFFDLRAGCYVPLRPSHPDVLAPSEARLLPFLFKMELSNLSHYRFTRQQRQRILEVINLYFRLHLPPFPELHSIAVLKEVFD